MRILQLISALAIGLPLCLEASQQTPAAPLRLDIKTTSEAFKQYQPIKFAVTLTNASQAPVRIMKPGLYFKMSGDVAAFRIERADGVVAEQRGSCRGTVMLGTAESRSIELAPAQGYQTMMDLWPEPSAPTNPTDGASLTSCWSYYFGKEYNAQLKKGQYKVSLFYTVPTSGNPRGWTDELKAKFGDLWRGQVSSNVVNITIK